MSGYVDYNLSLKRSWLKSQEQHRNKLKSISGTHNSRIDNSCPKFFQQPSARSIASVPSLILPSSQTVSASKRSLRKPPCSKVKKEFKRRVEAENKKLALALARSQPRISLQDFARDFKDSRKYKKLSSKPHIFERPVKSRLAPRQLKAPQ